MKKWAVLVLVLSIGVWGRGGGRGCRCYADPAGLPSAIYAAPVDEVWQAAKDALAKGRFTVIVDDPQNGILVGRRNLTFADSESLPGLGDPSRWGTGHQGPQQIRWFLHITAGEKGTILEGLFDAGSGPLIARRPLRDFKVFSAEISKILKAKSH
jgi:hypothetical protein